MTARRVGVIEKSRKTSHHTSRVRRPEEAPVYLTILCEIAHSHRSPQFPPLSSDSAGANRVRGLARSARRQLDLTKAAFVFKLSPNIADSAGRAGAGGRGRAGKEFAMPIYGGKTKKTEKDSVIP